MAWKGLTLTVGGRNALNDAQVSKKLNFKSVVVGDGAEPGNYNTRKELVHQLYEVTDLHISITETGCDIIVDFPSVEYDYYFREIGVVAATDDGDVLYVYDNCGNDAQFIVNTTGAETNKKRLRLSLVISDVDKITLSRPSILYVTYDVFEQAVEDLKKEATVSDAGLMSAEDKKKLDDIEEGAQENTVTSVNKKQGDVVLGAEDVGLGKVPNVATNDQTPTYGIASALAELVSGEKLSTAFGKIAKAVSSLISHLSASNPHNITKSTVGLGNADNTADANKSVKYATTAGSATGSTWTNQLQAYTEDDFTGGNHFVKAIRENGWQTRLVMCYLNGAKQSNEVRVGYADSAGAVAWGNISGKPSSYTPSSHNHDDRYYTESEINTKLNEKQNSLGFTPVQQGGGIGQSTNKIYIGWSGGSLKCTVDATDLGNFSFSGHTHPYLPLSGGTLTNWLYFGNSYASIFGEVTTLHLRGSGYINLRSPGIQCRSYNDDGWTGISAASFTNQSSKRYKENINLMTEERARKLLDIDVVTFDYRDGIVSDHQKDVPGVIVEWLVDLFPDVVHYRDIEDDDGNKQSLPDSADYIKFIPYQIKMLQIHQNELDTLKEENAELKNEITSLKDEIKAIKAAIGLA